MHAWLFAEPLPDPEVDALEEALIAAGLEVERSETLPVGPAELVVVWDDGTKEWEALEAAAGRAADSVIYFGSRSHQAERRMPFAVALPRPVRTASLRAALEKLGIPWGGAPAEAVLQREQEHVLH